MSIWLHREAGTVRSATPADAPAVSRLMARVGSDNLPVTAADIAALLQRGHLLVLDVGSGVIAAAAHVVRLQTEGERHAVFRYLAVHPALVRGDVRHRMTDAVLGVRDGADAGAGHVAMVKRALVRAPRGELARRIAYLTMILLSMPRVIASAGRNDAAVVMLVWSALALFTALRAPRIPRAIVRL